MDGHCPIVSLNNQRPGRSKTTDMEVWGRAIWVNYLQWTQNVQKRFLLTDRHTFLLREGKFIPVLTQLFMNNMIILVGMEVAHGKAQ